MTTEKGLQVFKEDGVFHIRLNAPSSKNAISLQLAQQLYNILHSTSLPDDLEGCGMLLVSSALDDIFASGGDLTELSQISREKSLSFISHMQSVCLTLSQFPIPTATLLNGPCYGGGAELALATDFRIAISDQAAFHFWQCRWGVPAGWHGSSRLQQLCFPHWGRRAHIAIATGESIFPPKALRMGLLDEILTSSHDADHWIKKKAQNFLACPASLRHSLLQRQTAEQESIEQQREQDHQLFQKFWKSGYHEEKLSAWRRTKG